MNPSVVALPDESVRAVQPTSFPQRVWRVSWRFLTRKPLGAFGIIFIFIVVVAGLGADVLAPYQYDDFDVVQRLQGPSWDHPFGTDHQGRDVFSRVIYGARTSLIIGFGSLLLATVLALAIGLVSAWFGGLTDLIAQRFVDVWMAFPGLMFVIFTVSVFGRSTIVLVVTLGLFFVAGSSRVVRSAAISVKHHAYVEAAKSVGASDLRLITRHVLPNVVPIVIVNFSVQIGAVILLETSLSFLGYGTPPPFPSWGRMLQEAQTEMQYHPYLAFFPGAAIALSVFAFNMFGDALRDTLDPRLRQR